MEVGAAGRGVAVQLDRAGVGGLHQVVHESRYPFAPGADLLPPGELGGDFGHPQRAVGYKQRRDAVVVAHHHRVGELAPQRLDLDAVSDGLKVTHHAYRRMNVAWIVRALFIDARPITFQVRPKSARLIRTSASSQTSP